MSKAKIPDSFLRARRALLLDHPFFGSLVLRLEPVIDEQCKSIWVDGKQIGFSSTFFDSLEPLEAAGVLAHEILHCALEHHLRRGERDHTLWNKAADYVTNPIVLKSGLKLPKDVLLNDAYAGKSAEEVYATLNTQKPQAEEGEGSEGRQQQPAPQGGGSQPNPEAGNGGSPQPSTGEVRDAAGEDGEAPSPAEKQEQGEEWKIAVQQAVNNAKGQGFFPAELERVAKEILTPKVDWREELRRFFQSMTRSEATWSRPNRRFIGSGLYLPGMRTEAAGPLVVGIDTSGSIGQRVLEQFAGELNAIVEDTQPERVYVVYCDARVQRVEEFTADDLPIVLQPRGGGGTSFRPVFDWVEQEGVQPDALVYLTDMCGDFPRQEPSYPVLWGSTSGHGNAPFGDIIHVKEIF
jgi:predicted metal-dependent peptidase